MEVIINRCNHFCCLLKDNKKCIWDIDGYVCVLCCVENASSSGIVRAMPKLRQQDDGKLQQRQIDTLSPLLLSQWMVVIFFYFFFLPDRTWASHSNWPAMDRFLGFHWEDAQQQQTTKRSKRRSEPVTLVSLGRLEFLLFSAHTHTLSINFTYGRKRKKEGIIKKKKKKKHKNKQVNENDISYCTFPVLLVELCFALSAVGGRTYPFLRISLKTVYMVQLVH